MSKHRLVAIILAVALILTLCGCWDRRELETVGFVTITGLDQGPDGKVLVTVHIAKPSALGGPESGSSNERSFWVVSTTGDTVLEAVRNLLQESPRRPYWQHNRLLVIGEDFAREGIRDDIDLFIRGGETRAQTQVVVAKGMTARDLLQAEYQLERMPAEGSYGLIQAAQSALSRLSPATLLEFVQRLETPGIEPVSVGAYVINEEPGEDNSVAANLTRKSVITRPHFTGGAIFKSDRLVGWFDDFETRGMLWIQGRAKGSVVAIDQPGHPGKSVGIDVLWSRCNVTPEGSGDRVVIRVDLLVEANVGDIEGPLDPLENPTEWTDLEQALASTVRSEALSAIDTAQNLGSDVFGFGRALSRTKPQEWKKLRDSWDNAFSEIEVRVAVRAKLRRYGLYLRGVTPR